ncbi:hypothetical protein [Thalassotalea atypica]|uniref:hypothetical protein n=1 Tax=Thalassotalea atypica TaxID=2054316 RepID=UPI0025736B25|nr:hypothetical protein [Thalassotalea atypica]
MKKVFYRVSIVILSMIVLSGCSESVTIQLEPDLTLFVSTDKETPIHLNAKDEAYATLANWLNENKDNWYSTSGKYPGGVYIVSGSDGIQITQRRVILYTITNGKPVAKYVQEIDQTELKVLKDI